MFSKIDATNPLCKYLPLHCVKSVQIRSYFWSVFSCIRIEYGDLLRYYGPEITPYLDTFHAVLVLLNFFGKLRVLFYHFIQHFNNDYRQEFFVHLIKLFDFLEENIKLRGSN